MRLLSSPATPMLSADARLLRRLARPGLVALVVAAFAIGFALTLALRGGEARVSPTGAASLPALLERAAAPLVVYSELGETADTLWAADPDNPTDRTQLARVEHAPGYGITPALSPDGAHVAYTVLAPGAGAPELWLLDIESGESELLLAGADLPAAPVWTPNGDAVVVRRSGATGEDAAVHVELLRAGLDGMVTTLAAHDSALYPIEFSPDGAWLYYASVSAAGSDLWRAPANGGAAQQVARLSDGISRDWDLSPDGARLAYLAQAGGDTLYTAQVLELAAGEAQAVAKAAGESQFAPVWETGGGLTTGRLGAAGGTPLRASIDGDVITASGATLPGAAGGGFDVPISWSPDGGQLAARHFAGDSTADPGPSRVELLGTDGERRALSTSSDITIAGWLEGAP